MGWSTHRQGFREVSQKPSILLKRVVFFKLLAVRCFIGDRLRRDGGGVTELASLHVQLVASPVARSVAAAHRARLDILGFGRMLLTIGSQLALATICRPGLQHHRSPSAVK